MGIRVGLFSIGVVLGTLIAQIKVAPEKQVLFKKEVENIQVRDADWKVCEVEGSTSDRSGRTEIRYDCAKTTFFIVKHFYTISLDK